MKPFCLIAGEDVHTSIFSTISMRLHLVDAKICSFGIKARSLCVHNSYHLSLSVIVGLTTEAHWMKTSARPFHQQREYTNLIVYTIQS